MKIKVLGMEDADNALKIEEKLKSDSRFSNVHVDFDHQTIAYKAKKAIDLDDLKLIITSVDPNIKLSDTIIRKHVYHISGLGCAGCASDFENKLEKQDYVGHAAVDFANEKLIIEYDDKDIDKIKEIASQYEDGLILSKTKIIDNENINWEILITIVLSIVLTVSTLLIDMSPQVEWLVLVLAYLVAGYSVLFKVVRNLLRGQIFDENFLMGLATVAAFGIGEYKEAIAVMVFYRIGEFFQDMAVNKSRKSIAGLMDIQAEYANLLVGDNIEQVDPTEVQIGDKVLIKAGEKIPLDGTIVEGETFLDTKALTGESVDVRVNVGSEVLSGSINKDSVIIVEVTKEYSDSTVAKILDLVENSSKNKAPTENFITKFAKVYTPIVVLLAVIVAFVPPLTFSTEGFYPWIYRSLIFLIISCPCALVISIPLGFFGGVGSASRQGILVKGANYLDALAHMDTLVCDKTGTLTKGNFSVVSINPEENVLESELLKTAAYAESYSNHPIAKSILEEYNNEVDLSIVSDYTEYAGRGIKVNIAGVEVLAGNYLLLEDNGIDAPMYDGIGTVIYVAKENKYLGTIEIADEIKEDTKEGIRKLKELGVENVVMLTGDNEKVAQKVANEIGITKFFAKLLPNEKVEKLEELEQTKKAKSKIAFVGDGINDAPVLTRADIGIAMGGVGSDAAIESADVVIMTDEISKIATAIKISKKTKKIVMQNIILAMVVKLAVLSLGLFDMATIWEAIIADVGVTVVAVLNTMRILNNKDI